MAGYGLTEFQGVCADVRKQQLHSLRSILTSNLNTKRLKDSGIVLGEDELAGADLGSLVGELPLTTYTDYQATLERALEAAERGDEEGYATAAGELISQRPEMLCCTTGTTGAAKLIPKAAGSLGPAMQAFAFMDRMLRLALPESAGGKELRLGWRAPIRVLPNGVWVGAVTACGTHKFLEQYDKGNPMVRALFAKSPSPVAVLKASDPHTAYFMHWLFALLDRGSIVGISGSFASEILSAVNTLLAHQDALLTNMAEGRLGAGWDSDGTSSPLVAPSKEILAELAPLLQPNPDLAAELREVFTAGRAGLLERLFPNLQSIKCICTGSMAKYVPALRQLAPSAPLLPLIYGATEAMLGVSAELVEYAERLSASGSDSGADMSLAPAEPGTPHQQHDSGTAHRQQSDVSSVAAASNLGSAGSDGSDKACKTRGGQTNDSPASVPPSQPRKSTPSFREFISSQDPGQASYILVPDAQVYLEFLPLDAAADDAPDEGRPQLVRMDELQVGGLYEVVVTNDLGFYRYRLGDRVRCVGHWKTAPKVVIEGRTTQDLNLSSEKIPDVFVRELVHSVARRLLPLGAAQLMDWAARECLHAAGSGVGHYIFYWELNPGSDDTHISLTTEHTNNPSTTSSGNTRGSISISDNNGRTGGNSTSGRSGDGPMPSLAACASALDAGLATPNSIYKSYRDMGRVGPVELRLVTPGSFAALAKLAFDRGASPGQYKPPVVLTAEAHIQLLDGRVLESAVAQG